MWPLAALLSRFQGRATRQPENPDADRDAIARIVAGEGAALAELYDRLGGAVFSLALRIVQDWSTAEDIVQDVFAQAWRQAGRYNAARGSVAAWLLMIARSRAIDQIRARRGRPDGVALDDLGWPVDLPEPGPGQEALALSSEQIERLARAIAELPMLQRIAIELAYMKV